MRGIPFAQALVLALATLAGGPLGIAAQGGPTVSILPRLGVLSPDDYFYEEFVNFGVDAPDEWTNGSLGRAAVIGAAVDVGWADRGILVRGEVARSLDGWVLATHAIVKPRVLFDPPEVVYTWYDLPAAITLATVQLILPTRFEFRGVRPYGLLGGGGKWYNFGSPTEEVTVDAVLPSDGFTATLEVGGGLAVTLFGLTFDAQIKDTVNRYWGKTQHDLVLSGGLLWRVR